VRENERVEGEGEGMMETEIMERNVGLEEGVGEG
jgi:hypothetical protein